MRILTISLNAWNDTLATGNTFSNFFSNRTENDVFANIYCREEKISNELCSKYFRITERDILSSLVHHKSAGEAFDVSKAEKKIESDSLLSVSNKNGNLLRRYRPATLLFLREFIWCVSTWKGKKLRKFLLDFRPEIIYMHVHTNWYMHKLLWYCQKLTGAKLVVFSGDDVWSYKRHGLLQRIYHWRLRKYLKYTFTHADIVCGGSPQLCEEFGYIFKIDIMPLYKTCIKLAAPNNKGLSYPLKAVYCGNLLYGRDEVLCQLVEQIRKFNKEKLLFQLIIYSNTSLTENQLKVLDDGYNSRFEGAKPYGEIVQILNECDFSIFAESYNPKFIKETRLSFSTKILDYMQASSVIIAVGPDSIASIDYLKQTGTALMLDIPESFDSVLEQVVDNPDIVKEYADKKYNYALKHHKTPTLLIMMRDLINV